jgi:hypothetical protein
MKLKQNRIIFLKMIHTTICTGQSTQFPLRSTPCVWSSFPYGAYLKKYEGTYLGVGLALKQHICVYNKWTS